MEVNMKVSFLDCNPVNHFSFWKMEAAGSSEIVVPFYIIYTASHIKDCNTLLSVAFV
jgi:hypothetical protein